MRVRGQKMPPFAPHLPTPRKKSNNCRSCKASRHAAVLRLSSPRAIKVRIRRSLISRTVVLLFMHLYSHEPGQNSSRAQSICMTTSERFFGEKKTKLARIFSSLFDLRSDCAGRMF